ncbi:hypothetical protein SCOCK_80216 [Actinacidiphila cocklensis]|uniref:Uncharacterized protein n=1 Tax=Actinacidiphila cocklensis TaxID=887465 RepID=A0A9W4EBN9_9ACTN|nr:hypothetical protein SCOCK_80216 [Actinacidiphila cocklensis]
MLPTECVCQPPLQTACRTPQRKGSTRDDHARPAQPVPFAAVRAAVPGPRPVPRRQLSLNARRTPHSYAFSRGGALRRPARRAPPRPALPTHAAWSTHVRSGRDLVHPLPRSDRHRHRGRPRQPRRGVRPRRDRRPLAAGRRGSGGLRRAAAEPLHARADRAVPRGRQRPRAVGAFPRRGHQGDRPDLDRGAAVDPGPPGQRPARTGAAARQAARRPAP